VAPSPAQPRGYSDNQPFPAGYSSTILKLFVESLARGNDVQALDAGPVCQENINFFAQRMRRHYACDMFIRLQRLPGEQPRPGNLVRHLDYPARSFDGIELWDLIDHLDDDQARQLMARCSEMLKTTGVLMLIALEKKPEPARINTFVVGRDYRVGFRLQPHLELAWHCRHNRALMSLLAEFEIVRSFRYVNGLREFLLKKPTLTRARIGDW
jgi:hypothetical protein